MRYVLLLLVFALSGCGATAVGCDFREDSVNGAENRCQERDGADSAAFAATCAGLKGEVVDGGCDRTNAIALCDLAKDNPLTNVNDVFYAPMTVAEAMAECAGDSGSFTAL